MVVGVTPMTALMISLVHPSSAMICSFDSVVLRTFDVSASAHVEQWYRHGTGKAHRLL